MSNTDKNKQIAETLRLTRDKRSKQRCTTITLKIDKSSLNKEQKEALKMKFVEAKRIYNYILGQALDPFILDYKSLNHISYLDRDKNNIEYELQYIKSSELQGIVDVMKQNIKGLSRLKANGNVVGHLKFKSEYNSIYYKQYGVTHYIKSSNKMKIQGIKDPIRVNGLKQIDRLVNPEFASMQLIYTGYDWFIKLVCFSDKENKQKEFKHNIIGIDLGCADTISLSNGTKVDIKIQESERLKKLERKLEHQKKGSKNRYKTKMKIRKEYNHISNKKEDISNKIVHDLTSNYAVVVTQDDPISEWHKVKYDTDSENNKHRKKAQTSKTVQHSVLGRLKSKLKAKDNVVFLDRWIPTSKFCAECGTKNDDLKIEDRTFYCPVCGHIEDRDLHAATNMVYFYMKLKDASGTDVTSKLVSYHSFKELVAKQEDTTL